MIMMVMMMTIMIMVVMMMTIMVMMVMMMMMMIMIVSITIMMVNCRDFQGYADKEATKKKVMKDVWRKGDMCFR